MSAKLQIETISLCFINNTMEVFVPTINGSCLNRDGIAHLTLH